MADLLPYDAADERQVGAPLGDEQAGSEEARPSTTPLRILIVDDEEPARRRLRRLLSAMSEVVVVGEAASGPEAVERIGECAPDLVLLDVQMPVLDGFGVVEQVGARAMPPVVFVTAHDAHAVRAFEVRALDYLLKPVAPARLREAVRRAAERRDAAAPVERGECLTDGESPADDERLTDDGPSTEGRGGGSAGGALPNGPAAPADYAERLAQLLGARTPYLHRILVHGERGALLLPVQTIRLARAERNYVALHAGTAVHRVRGTIGALAERLDPAHFLRVNRSDVIRLDAIRELQPWSHGDYRVVLDDGTALLWSRRFRSQAAGAFALDG